MRHLASGHPRVQKAEQLFGLLLATDNQRTEMQTSLSQARAPTTLRTLDLPSSSGERVTPTVAGSLSRSLR